METENRFMTLNECAKYLKVGISSTRKYMKEIGAEKRIGKRVVYDRKVIDKYFDNENGIGQAEPDRIEQPETVTVEQ